MQVTIDLDLSSGHVSEVVPARESISSTESEDETYVFIKHDNLISVLEEHHKVHIPNTKLDT